MNTLNEMKAIQIGLKHLQQVQKDMDKETRQIQSPALAKLRHI